MKTKQLLWAGCLLSLLALSQYSNAQDKKTFRFTLQGGVSSPISDYSDVSARNELSGYALNGIDFGFNGYYYLLNGFGIGTGISYSANALDEVSYGTNYLTNHGNSLAYDLEPKNLAIETTIYKHTCITFGMIYSKDFGTKKKIGVDVRLGGGMDYFTTPAINTILYYDDPTPLMQREEYFIDESTGSAFLFKGGFSLRYKFGKRIGVSVNFDFNNMTYDSAPKYTYEEKDNDVSYYYETGTTKWLGGATWLGSTLGITYTVGKTAE